MSHEVLITRRLSIFDLFANPGRGGPQKAGASWCWLPGMLRPASAWICKKIKNALSSGYQDLMGHLILTTSPWFILTWITLLYMVVCLNFYGLIGDFGPAVTLAHFCLFKECFFTKILQWHLEGFSKLNSKIWHFRLQSRELSWITCPSQLKSAEFIQYDFLGNCVWLVKSLEGLWWSFTNFNNVILKDFPKIQTSFTIAKETRRVNYVDPANQHYCCALSGKFLKSFLMFKKVPMYSGL